MTSLSQLDSGGDPNQLYCHELEAMRDEMSNAMLAISGNFLEVFEDSLWRQQVLCLSLTRLLSSIQNANPDSHALTSIHSATFALHRLCASYAELVQQSRASTELLYTLCRSYKDSIVSNTDEPPPNRCSFEA